MTSFLFLFLFLNVQVLEITAVSLNISASLLETNCSLTLDLLLEQTKLFSKDTFNVVVSGQRGRLPEVTVHVLRPPSFGTLQSFQGNQRSPINFSYTLLLEEQVFYNVSDKFIQQYSDSFDVQFTLGHGRSEVITVTLCIYPLPYPVLTHMGTPLTVFLHGQNSFSVDFLTATQTRLGNKNDTYLFFEVVSTPRYGVILDENSLNTVSSIPLFTQADVNERKIIYLNKKRNDEGNMTDKFQFRLSNQYYQLDTLYTAWIKLEENVIEVVNEGLNVSEGSIHLITKNELFAIAPNGYEVTHIYVLSQPKEGNLEVRRSRTEPLVVSPPDFSLRDIEMGYLSYVHLNRSGTEETNMDEFSFLFVAKKESHPILDFPGLCNITINLVNDNRPVLLKNDDDFTVVEGSSEAITTDNLSFTDYDYGYNDENLMYVLRHGPYQGELCLHGNCSKPDQTFIWYQKDMHGDLVYNHTKLGESHYTDIVLFSVFDDKLENGGFEVSAQLFKIKISPVMPKRIGNALMLVFENSYALLHPANLNFTSQGSVMANEYKYQVTQLPKRGSLFNTNSQLTANEFTQLDIDNQYILYLHDGSNDNNDIFKVKLVVRSFELSDNTVDIVIIPVNDDLPSLTVNREIFVDYNSLVHLNKSHLTIVDTDTPESYLLKYIIQSSPKFGVLEKRESVENETYETLLQGSEFTQKDINNENVRYRHSNFGGYEDSFTFDISDGANRVPSKSSSVFIVPEEFPIAVRGATVDEGGNVTLGSNSISVEHPYFSMVNGKVVIIRNVQFGYLTINGKPCTKSSKCDFYTKDLAKGKIKYYHDGGEDREDNFEFFIEWPGHPRTHIVDLNITILPVNNQHPVVVNSTGLTVRATETVPLTQSHLLTTDADTSPENLVYKFTLNPEEQKDGHFSYRGKPEQTNNTFTQEDIDNGLIVYVDTHTYNGDRHLKFTVSDGIFKETGVFVVTAYVVTLTTVANKKLSVDMGDSINLTREVLSHVTNNKDRGDSQIWYHVVGKFSYGLLVGGDGKEKHVFTQADIDSGLLLYRHTGVDVWESEDVAQVVVYARFALENISLSLGVDIRLLNESTPLAINKPLYVIEGNSFCINNTHLDGRNIRYAVWKDNGGNLTLYETQLRYSVTTPPHHGQLLVNGTESLDFTHEDLVSGDVCYRNDGTENSMDEFRFDVVVSSPFQELGRVSDVAHMHIALVNDEVPVMETLPLHIYVVSGFWYKIKPEDLRVTDKDTPPENITFTVSLNSLDNSVFRVRNAINSKRFTQADINRGDVMFLSNKTGFTTFEFIYSDGPHSGGNTVFDVTVKEHIVHFLYDNQSLEFYQTEIDAIISSTILNSTTNGYRYHSQYTITSQPVHGEIIVNGAVMDTFSQVDVDSGAVRYRLSDFGASEDSLNLKLSNMEANSSEFTLRVVVRAKGIFSTGYSLPPKMTAEVPAGIINLDELSKDHRTIVIDITSKLKYGHLIFKYPNTNVGSRHISSFGYDDLKNGYVHYNWTPSADLTVGENYTEVIEGVVRVKGLALGQFSFTITVQAPAKAVPPSPSQTSPIMNISHTNTEVSDPSTSKPSAFNYSLYVPMIGLIIVVFVAFVVVVGFCCSQSKHIKRKLYHKPPIPFPAKEPPTPKATSQRMSPMRPAHSPVITGDIGLEDSDSESSTPNVTMMQTRATQPPMTTISASHTFLPHSPYLYDAGIPGYSTIQGEPSPTQLTHEESPTGSNFPPNASYNMVFMRGNEMRSSSPVRRVSPTRRNTRPYASMTKVTGKGRSSPSKGLREYPAPSPLHSLQFRPQIRDSSSSLGYDTSSMTQESVRLPSVSTPTPSNLESLINQENISELYRKAPPVLQSPQYWV